MRNIEAAARMYSLLEVFENGREELLHRVSQGTTCAITFARVQDQARFVDHLLIGGGEQGTTCEFLLHGRGLRLRKHVSASQIAVVARVPTLLGQSSVRDNIALAGTYSRQGVVGFGQRVHRAMRETGLLDGVDLDVPASTLSWPLQVEANFLQAWLREPQWLLFDGVYDHEEAKTVDNLPSLFTRRFPLRSICYLGRQIPALGPSTPTQVIAF